MRGRANFVINSVQPRNCSRRFVVFGSTTNYEPIPSRQRKLLKRSSPLLNVPTTRKLLLIAHDVMGDNSLWAGDFSAAHLHTAQGIALYDPVLDRDLAYGHGGYDPAMACRAFGAHALWYLGFPDRAAKQSQDAVKFARELGHPQSLVHALGHGALLHQFRRDARSVLEHALAALELSRELEFRFLDGASSNLSGVGFGGSGAA